MSIVVGRACWDNKCSGSEGRMIKASVLRWGCGVIDGDVSSGVVR